MTAEWHYTKDGQKYGPLSAAELKALARSGQLAPTDMVWKAGMAEWKVASSSKRPFPSPPDSTTERQPPPPPLPATSPNSPHSDFLAHPVVRKILSDKLLLLGCCLGVSVVLTVLVPSLLAPSRLSTFPPDILAEPGFENVKDWSDSRLEAEIDRRQRENTRNAGRLATSGMTTAAFVLIDIALVALIGFVGYRRYFATATDKLYEQGGPELPPNYPWTREDRAAPNPKHLWVRVGIGACIVIGVICLLSIVGAIFCLPFFSAAILLYVFGLNRRLFHGRWLLAEGKGWVEFLPGHVVKREDGSVSSFALLPNQTFIDFLDAGRLVDSWKVLAFEHSTHLEVLDMAGKSLNFKRAKIGVYKGSSLFASDRSNLLTEKWEPVSGDGPAIQFTDDGAMIRFDGFAAKYTFAGEEPNEIITVHVSGTETIELRVLSLSRDEMVLTGDGGSVHYKRGVSISAAEAKRRSDAFNEKMKAVGKGALLTVGAIGAGIAILGVAAAATASTTCRWCGYTTSGLHMNCPNCGR